MPSTDVIGKHFESSRAVKLEALRAEIRKGVDSGEAVSADQVFDRLTVKYKRME